MKRRFFWTTTLTAALLLLSPIASWATIDRSTQRMAGFSADGNYYVYLESSRDAGAGIPRSRLQIMDVATNRCVPSGCLETSYREPDSGISLQASEDGLLQSTWRLRQTLGLTPPNAGRRLTIQTQARTPDRTETTTVRLENGQSMRLRLEQRYIPSTMNGGTAEVDRASMRLEITYGGQRRAIGSLNTFRDWVLRYSVREVILSPDGRSVAVLITALKPSFEAQLETTLVQTFRLN